VIATINEYACDKKLWNHVADHLNNETANSKAPLSTKRASKAKLKYFTKQQNRLEVTTTGRI
jgi:hypothetical protein